MVGHFNNSRVLKHNFLELSHKAVNWIFDWDQSMITMRDNLYRRAFLVKVQSGFKSFFCQIMKGISKFMFSVMSYMVGHFNNSRALKNTLLQLSYKAVNWILDWAQTSMTARNNLYRRAVLVRYNLEFNVFLQNHARLIKYCFLGNVLHPWRFQ